MKVSLSKHVFLIGLTCLSCCFFEKPIKAEEPKQEDMLQTIMNKIERNKSKIQEKKQAKRMVEQELGSLSKELRHTEIYLNNAQKKLSLTQEKIKQTQGKLAQYRSEYTLKNQKFSKRIVDIYKNKNMEVLEFIFAPNDLVSVVDSSYYFERLMKIDVSMIDDIKRHYGLLVNEHKNLQAQHQTLAQLKVEISEKENQLSQKKTDQEHYLDSLHSEIAEIERTNKELEQSSQEITSQILRSARGKKGYYGTGHFIKPTEGWLSSLFGIRFHPIFKRKIRHMGIDLASKSGVKIHAADSGIVIVAGEPPQYRGYGKIVIIDHGEGRDGKRVSTIYAHQSRILVQEGETVKQGDIIGLVGSTGHATGPHLHFEIRLDGIPVNPLEYVRL